jgi:hypothetical protein
MKPTALHIERWLDGVEARIVPPERRGLRVIIHEGDDEAAAMEKAVAEHIAAHPEDAGRTVKDFKWIVRVIMPPLNLTIGADGRQRWLGDTDGGKFEDTDLSEGKFEDTDGPSETLVEPIDLPPPDPGCLARSKPWRPVHQRPARDMRRPTWKKWEQR